MAGETAYDCYVHELTAEEKNGNLPPVLADESSSICPITYIKLNNITKINKNGGNDENKTQSQK